LLFNLLCKLVYNFFSIPPENKQILLLVQCGMGWHMPRPRARSRKVVVCGRFHLGLGFKCNNLIMKAMMVFDREEKNPWSGEIDEFPVDLKSTEGSIPYEFKPSKKI